MARPTTSEQHTIRDPRLLALWQAAIRLGIRQGSKESREFEGMGEEKEEEHGSSNIKNHGTQQISYPDLSVSDESTRRQ